MSSWLTNVELITIVISSCVFVFLFIFFVYPSDGVAPNLLLLRVHARADATRKWHRVRVKSVGKVKNTTTVTPAVRAIVIGTRRTRRLQSPRCQRSTAIWVTAFPGADSFCRDADSVLGSFLVSLLPTLPFFLRPPRFRSRRIRHGTHHNAQHSPVFDVPKCPIILFKNSTACRTR